MMSHDLIARAPLPVCRYTAMARVRGFTACGLTGLKIKEYRARGQKGRKERQKAKGKRNLSLTPAFRPGTTESPVMTTESLVTRHASRSTRRSFTSSLAAKKEYYLFPIESKLFPFLPFYKVSDHHFHPTFIHV